MAVSNNVKIVVFVPESHTDIIREVMARAGAGKIGNYTSCSFSSKGTGWFKPEDGAHPAIGEVGILEFVAEERIEMLCSRDYLNDVIIEMKKAHPYEEVAYDIYPLEDL